MVLREENVEKCKLSFFCQMSSFTVLIYMPSTLDCTIHTPIHSKTKGEGSFLSMIKAN